MSRTLSTPAARRLQACLLALGLVPWAAAGDVLIAVNGERFVGRVISESAEAVVFESELGGRLTVPRAQVRELERTPDSGSEPAAPGAAQETPQPVAAASQPPAPAPVTNLSTTAWLPPGIGSDGWDWLQLTSGEWLKGELIYARGKRVEFESDKLDELTLKKKNISQFYSGKPLFVKFEDQEPLFGTVILTNDLIEVIGPEQVKLPVDELTGIAPGDNTELGFWSFRANVGLSLQSGNTRQATLNTSAQVARRTPASQFLLDYLATFSRVESVQTANDQRLNGTYDLRLNRDWFVRPLQLEWYRDPLANISGRVTAGVGAGYFIFNSDSLEWYVAAGPAYQYTRHVTVEAGESRETHNPAGVFQSVFKVELTDRVDFSETFYSTVTSRDAGRYSHHTVTSLEYEIKRHLDLNVSFIWDYLNQPQAEASGAEPLKSDFRLIFGVGVRF